MNCSSLGGLVGLPNRAAYHGSKHGVLGLTKCAALDFATKNIRVNAVCPGTIETPMSAGIDHGMLKEIMRDQSIGRFGRPEDVEAAVLCAATRPASSSASHCRWMAASPCTDEDLTLLWAAWGIRRASVMVQFSHLIRPEERIAFRIRRAESSCGWRGVRPSARWRR
ncbi:SDR family oxidoreductase [Bradyrhizobium sp. F1.13.3]|uniref:SDR family oxidoreductase n=1 Tax=Bradyrhizobium sp. F1.13.3 TaxID=3156351 RepID=UPI00339789B4